MRMRERLYSLLNGDGRAAMWYGRIMTVLIIASLLPEPVNFSVYGG